jgi:hypothetical protein
LISKSLVDCAKARRTCNYSEVAATFGRPFTQGFIASLMSALKHLDIENTNAGEPHLMCLVVKQDTGIPGQGYYAAIGHGTARQAEKRTLFEYEAERCWGYLWP